MRKPLISIITATFNAKDVLEKSILSVLAQSYTNFEYILIDGDSTDGTKELIEKYKNYISYTSSEKDNGIYDAWNKGLVQATGEWVMFIGADDCLAPDALHSYVDYINTQNSESTLYISSKVKLLSEKGQITRIYGWPWNWSSFRKVNLIAHPGSLHSRSLFENYGLYDITYKIAGDYELLLRPREKLNALFLNKVTAYVMDGGLSSKIDTFYELRKAILQSKSTSKIQAFLSFYTQVFKFIMRKMGQKLGLTLHLRSEY